MTGIENLPLFVTTAVLVNLTPGQDTLYVLGRAAAGGPREGIAAALGVSLGCLGHAIAAALGLAALIAASPALFGLMRLAGAAWLAWIGAGLLGKAWAMRGASKPDRRAAAAALASPPTVVWSKPSGFRSCTSQTRQNTS
jgi:threonine/homoserine/homoserine lactone efflux protein